MNHRKPYNLIRPYCASQSAHFDEKNIFMDSLDELSLRQDSDRYIVGLKDVRIYKNKLKRKQKLTPAVPVIMKQLSETESMKISNSLLTGQQVIDCLPKVDSSIILRQKSRKGIRAFHSKQKIEWDTKGKMLGISSRLMESVHQYREIVEKRQQSSRMNGLSFKKCEEWKNRETTNSYNTIVLFLVAGVHLALWIYSIGLYHNQGLTVCHVRDRFFVKCYVYVYGVMIVGGAFLFVILTLSAAGVTVFTIRRANKQDQEQVEI